MKLGSKERACAVLLNQISEAPEPLPPGSAPALTRTQPGGCRAEFLNCGSSLCLPRCPPLIGIVRSWARIVSEKICGRNFSDLLFVCLVRALGSGSVRSWTVESSTGQFSIFSCSRERWHVRSISMTCCPTESGGEVANASVMDIARPEFKHRNVSGRLGSRPWSSWWSRH